MGLLVALLALPLLQPAWGAKTSSRVVAVGDVHGDLDALVSILQETGIIDDQRRWSGGNATLVLLLSVDTGFFRDDHRFLLLRMNLVP